MTTRHVSAEVDYPFIPELPAFERSVSSGILDLWFIIQGEPSYTETASSASASSSAPVVCDTTPLVRLIGYTASGADTIFTFHAIKDLSTWVITFTVPNTGAETGQVDNDDTTAVHAVLIFNSDNIPSSGSADVEMEVEPARAQWHTEVVDTITFKNIYRCSSIEDDSVLSTIYTVSSSSPLHIENGHNTEISFEDSILTFTAEQGIGQGVSPDIGDASDCPAAAFDDQVVTTINGVSPVSGNIPIGVSNRLGKQRSTGRLELIARRG